MTLLATRHAEAKLIRVGIPRRAPPFGHHLLAVDIHPDISGIIKYKPVHVLHRGLDEAFVCDVRAVELEPLRQIDDGLRVFKIEAVLIAGNRLSVFIGVHPGQSASHAILII